MASQTMVAPQLPDDLHSVNFMTNNIMIYFCSSTCLMMSFDDTAVFMSNQLCMDMFLQNFKFGLEKHVSGQMSYSYNDKFGVKSYLNFEDVIFLGHAVGS